MSKIFLDTNVFIYFIVKHPKYYAWSERVLTSIKSAANEGYTSIVVMDELLFKLIIAEVVQKFRIKMSKAVKFLKKNPQHLKRLKAFYLVAVVEKIPNLMILTVDKNTYELAKDHMRSYGLLTHDAFHSAVCQLNKIDTIATNDSDFDKINFLKVWKP